MKLHQSQIESYIERHASSQLSIIFQTLLDAINDWPSEVNSVDDFEIEVSNFINGIPNEKNIQDFNDKINLAINGWRAESLTQVLEIFKYYPINISLKEIIQLMKEEVKLT